MKGTLALRFRAMLTLMVIASFYSSAWIIWSTITHPPVIAEAVSKIMWENITLLFYFLLLSGGVGFFYGWRAIKVNTTLLRVLGISLLTTLLLYAIPLGILLGITFLPRGQDYAEGVGFVIYFAMLSFLPTLAYTMIALPIGFQLARKNYQSSLEGSRQGAPS